MSTTQSKPIIKNEIDDKFETFLFLPENNNTVRYGEGGLRKKNIFKKFKLYAQKIRCYVLFY